MNLDNRTGFGCPGRRAMIWMMFNHACRGGGDFHGKVDKSHTQPGNARSGTKLFVHGHVKFMREPVNLGKTLTRGEVLEHATRGGDFHGKVDKSHTQPGDARSGTKFSVHGHVKFMREPVNLGTLMRGGKSRNISSWPQHMPSPEHCLLGPGTFLRGPRSLPSQPTAHVTRLDMFGCKQQSGRRWCGRQQSGRCGVAVVRETEVWKAAVREVIIWRLQQT